MHNLQDLWNSYSQQGSLYFLIPHQNLVLHSGMVPLKLSLVLQSWKIILRYWFSISVHFSINRNWFGSSWKGGRSIWDRTRLGESLKRPAKSSWVQATLFSSCTAHSTSVSWQYFMTTRSFLHFSASWSWIQESSGKRRENSPPESKLGVGRGWLFRIRMKVAKK